MKKHFIHKNCNEVTIMTTTKKANDYTDYRIPGIVATEAGTLLRYCECRRSQGDWADIDIKVWRSEDLGETWEPVLTVESGGNTMNNPVMLVNGKTLIFLYCKNYRELWKCISTDDGKSFEKAERVPFEADVHFFYNVVAVGPGHGILHHGRLLVPAWFACDREDPKSHHPSIISTLYSDDGGMSWHLGEVIYPETLINPSECALAVTDEDEILISIRHEGEPRRRALAKSADGIGGWKELCFASTLADPVCMGSMTHRDGTVYHINCDSESKRRNLTVKLSRDGFATCHALPVSESAGYSDLALIGDELFLFYEKINAAGRFELCFERKKVPSIGA